MTFSDLKRKHEIIQKLIDAIGDSELSTLSKFMRSRISYPESYVTMLGETSSGKTTLINGLLKERLLKTSAAPTTGSIVEVLFDSEIKSPEYYAINCDATMEQLDVNTFVELSSNPDELLSRLQIAVPEVDGLAGLRLFDTPGYGSIVDKHEEVLREFIPNSDVIIYVIGYKIGIQENDFLFMRCIQELIHDDTDVIVVVNRCPATVSEKDRRMTEIRRYAEDLFHRNIPIFTVVAEANNTGETLPQATDLWAYVNKLLNSQERQQTLINTLNAYLDDLLAQADSIIEKHEIANLMSQKEKEELSVCADNLRQKGTNIVITEIVPTFDRLIANTPRLLEQAKETIYAELSESIDDEKTGRMDETIAFVNNHSLPLAINRETKEYERRLMLELDAMNERVDDYLNEAIANYYHEIELHFASNAELAVRASGGKIVGKMMENGLRQYFAAFGGAGGAGAGVANAAKHLLKKTGDLFGKRFSRETYNALAHTLKKIGFTSVKTIGNIVTVIIEVAQVIIDYSTWKPKLKKQVKKGLGEWYDKTVETVTKDLGNLKSENIKTLKAIINDVASAYELEAEEMVENMPELIALKAETHKKLEEVKL